MSDRSSVSFTERRERIRAILAGDELVRPAPVHDPMTMRMAEDLGFEIALLPAPIAQVLLLAVPNHYHCPMTLTELVDHVRRMCRAASTVSLIAHAQDGFGNAINLMRCVEELELAGASCILIDDHIMPGQFGNPTYGPEPLYGQIVRVKHRLVPLDEMVGRLKAAIAARRDKSLVIVPRSMMIRAGGPDIMAEIPRRVRAYEQAGVDAIFLMVGAEVDERDISLEAIQAVHAETKLPLMGGQGADVVDTEFLKANGFRIAQGGNLTILAGLKAMYETLKAMREGKATAELKHTLFAPELFAKTVRQDQYDEWTKEFLL